MTAVIGRWEGFSYARTVERRSQANREEMDLGSRIMR